MWLASVADRFAGIRQTCKFVPMQAGGMAPVVSLPFSLPTDTPPISKIVISRLSQRAPKNAKKHLSQTKSEILECRTIIVVIVSV